MITSARNGSEFRRLATSLLTADAACETKPGQHTLLRDAGWPGEDLCFLLARDSSFDGDDYAGQVDSNYDGDPPRRRSVMPRLHHAVGCEQRVWASDGS